MTRPLTLTAGVVLALALAGCSLLAPPPAEPEPAPVEESNAPAPVPTLSDEEVTAQFLIPAGISDQELAEAYVDRKSRWWNFGAVEELGHDDEGRHELGLTDYAQSIADRHADVIAEAWLTRGNTDDKENAIALNANTLAHYIQSLLREEKPYTHTLTLISLDEYGDNGDIHVLRVTVREHTSDPTEPVNSRLNSQWELHWVVEGDYYKLQDAFLAN